MLVNWLVCSGLRPSPTISATTSSTRKNTMAQDYDEARPDVAEASERTLKDVQKMDAPDAKSVHSDLDETDFSDGQELPGAIVLDELVVEVIPQGIDEFVCGECFSVRHRSQAAKTLAGATICRECDEL
jgi:hypothetical protein